MRRIALVFPGQGSEEPGMGLTLARVDARAASLLALASHRCGVDLGRALERGGRALARTDVIQPALLAVALGAARALESRGVSVDAVIGHSLGELGAACFALDCGDETAIALAATRGALMHELAERAPGGMIAVRAEHDGALAPALALGLSLAAHNAPDERVLSGPRALLAPAERALGVPSRRLAVAGPWHSPAMEPAVAPFDRALRAALPGPTALRAALYSAVSARALATRDEIVDALATGLVRPVRWVETLRALAQGAGVTDVVALAPSRLARSLVRRTLDRSVTIHAADDPASLDACARDLA